ncbi:cytochrome P450 [Sphingobium sufflavum]|uniref:cytochrome P450 n=1 Tax=Sphingobium sufflavum TaxID=1129547 RepID=UPI001F32C1BB|nr:cytochrome P450 [Sphingobium sufflavum]MCE7798863.1 cytochrome P450 [Sphingobium sufflavum]
MLEDIDFYTDLSLVENPMPYFEAIRKKGAVHRLPNRNVFAVTGYEEAIQVYSDTGNFSSVNAVTGPIPDVPFVPEGDDIGEQLMRHRPDMPFSSEVVGLDAPDHARMRSLLMPLFTPGKLKSKEEGFRAVANRLIDEFIEQGLVEFIKGYANPLATLIITELLGVPEADRKDFRKFFEGGTAGEVGASAETIAYNPLIEMGMRIAGYIAERRQNPTHDVLTEFALAKFPDGSTPTLEEAARVASFLFGAGQDTTVKLLGTSFRILAEHKHIQEDLRREPARIPACIEEVLRFQGGHQDKSSPLQKNDIDWRRRHTCRCDRHDRQSGS